MYFGEDFEEVGVRVDDWLMGGVVVDVLRWYRWTEIGHRLSFVSFCVFFGKPRASEV